MVVVSHVSICWMAAGRLEQFFRRHDKLVVVVPEKIGAYPGPLEVREPSMPIENVWICLGSSTHRHTRDATRTNPTSAQEVAYGEPLDHHSFFTASVSRDRIMAIACSSVLKKEVETGWQSHAVGTLDAPHPWARVQNPCLSRSHRLHDLAQLHQRFGFRRDADQPVEGER